MAQKTQVTLVDDVSGEEITDGGQTVTFGLDGTRYEIDLNQKNSDRLRSALAPYIAAGRKVAGRATNAGRANSRPPQSADSAKPDARAAREWAASNGIELSARGRIPADVIKKFQEAKS
ncbi:histone-like nucleoid-structuring protein Lsr2 [Cellulomonas endophytica]|uniref:histone-like nucleoid-structuring protein Lsr2 n=1 Tax=Cellulomonas endophytica TaxID=2494735 RepID=UPI0010103AFB|nr:Lsr2 family protein [Cellulomonas endophytica]